MDLKSARLDRTTLAGADLRRAHLGIRKVTSEGVEATDEEINDDAGVGALLVNTDLSGVDLSNADLNGVVMVGGSLRGARLRQANTKGARWLGVVFQRTLCPDGSARSLPCPGFQVPQAGPERTLALARVAWLRSLPWPLESD